MVAGLPMVCSNRGPMPEMLGDAGIYFNPERTKEIRDALEIMMTDNDRLQRMAEASFERAAQFTWKRCAEETFDFLAKTALKFQEGYHEHFKG